MKAGAGGGLGRLAGLGALALLAACGRFSDDRVTFDGHYYPATLSRVEGARERFVITVKGIGQGLDGAREAGRYEATKYCIRNYGSSEADWTVGPDAPAGALPMQGDALMLQGACAEA